MFGSSKPVVFEPYGRRRSRWRLPRWLVLLLAGIGAGAAGLVLVQERYLPPRLSADESVRLRGSFEHAESQRLRLTGELGETRKRLDAALADQRRMQAELSASREAGERAREVATAVIAALPPDPRGGAVEVRAARFSHAAGALAYEVVLTRGGGLAKPLPGVLQFVVSGTNGKGAEATANLAPVAVSIGSFESLRGSVALPEGFKPRQATINVLDREGGRLLGKRVIHVK